MGYVLSRDGIKPQSEKVSAILALREPQNVKEMRMFLGMSQYYRDVWTRRSHMITPLTDLVGETGETKVTRAAGTKIKKWYWTQVHQDEFELVNHTLAEEVTLAYPDYGEVFQIYTDASQRQ